MYRVMLDMVEGAMVDERRESRDAAFKLEEMVRGSIASGQT